MRDTRRTRLVLGVLLAAALALIAVSYADRSNHALAGVRSMAGSVTGGAERTGSAVGRFFTGSRGGSSSGSGSGSGSGPSATGLERQVLQLQAELGKARVSRAQAAQLRQMLLVGGASQEKIMAATVIAVGQGAAGQGADAVTVDVGSANGVRVGQTVLNDIGLVGAVTAVTPHTATVQLASTPSVTIGVAVSPKGQLGFVHGSAGVMRLQMLGSAAVLKPGEQLVTGPTVSGSSYVPGVPVGVITKLISTNGALTESADVRPYVDYSALSVVGIILAGPAKNPGFAAVPPLPHPAPAITKTVTAKPTTSPSAPPPTPAVGG